MRSIFILSIIISAITTLKAEEKNHVVKNGESLMVISNLYYGTHHCHHLIKRNNKEKSATLEIGEVLTIPASENCKHPNAKKRQVIAVKRKGTVNTEIVKFPLTSPTQFLLSDSKTYKQINKSPPADFKKKFGKIYRRKGGILIGEEKKEKMKEYKKASKMVNGFYIQVGALPILDEAQKVCTDFEYEGYSCFISKLEQKNKVTLFRSRIGPYASKDLAQALLNEKIIKEKSSGAWIVEENNSDIK